MFADLHCSHCSLRPIQVNFLRPAFSARPLWMPSTAAVLKTATMHSLIMTNARGDLISRLCNESKIPQTRWRFLPGIRLKLTHAGTQTHAHWQTRGWSDKTKHKNKCVCSMPLTSPTSGNPLKKFQRLLFLWFTASSLAHKCNYPFRKKKDIAFSIRISLRRRNAQKWTFGSSCHVRLSRQCPKPKHLIGKPVRRPSTNYIRNDNIKEIKTLVGLVDDKDWRQ